jgi:hypothetical protein
MTDTIDLSTVPLIDLRRELAKRGIPIIIWLPNDVATLRPDWSAEKCAEWLADHVGHIENRSVELGWTVIETLVADSEPSQGAGQ